MNKRVESSWLLLIHQIPAVPAYLRIKVGRRLARVGALALKGSVYALPVSDSSREDFSWIRREIVDGGGEAMVFEARAVEGIGAAELEQLFRDARAKDYAALAAELGALGDQARSGSQRERQAALAEVARVEQRLRDVQRVDFFQQAASADLVAQIEALKQRLEQRGKLPKVAPRASCRSVDYQARTWVTRTGIKVDRMACAWLIRRHIDKTPKFRFVDPVKHTPKKGELRFDMSEGEFSHEGELCSFEVLCLRFGVSKPEIVRLGEVIHDLDIKDGRYAHPETEGLRKLLDGIVAQRARDEERLEASSALFDAFVAATPGRAKGRRSRRGR
jgi:hypothetical protein